MIKIEEIGNAAKLSTNRLSLSACSPALLIERIANVARFVAPNFIKLDELATIAAHLAHKLSHSRVERVLMLQIFMSKNKTESIECRSLQCLCE